MLVKDGREILAEVKFDPKLRGIPMVQLTASGAQEDIVRSYDPARQRLHPEAGHPRAAGRGGAGAGRLPVPSGHLPEADAEPTSAAAPRRGSSRPR
jgi:hypothetical protein